MSLGLRLFQSQKLFPINAVFCCCCNFVCLETAFPVSSSLKITQIFLKDDYGLSGKDEGPKVTPMLDWVYGYRGKDSRANLDKLPTGEVSKMVSWGSGWKVCRTYIVGM